MDGYNTIDDLDLDMRTANCMARLSDFLDAGFHNPSDWRSWENIKNHARRYPCYPTIRMVCSYTKWELLNLPNLGKKSIRRLEEALAEIGFKLGTPLANDAEICYYCEEPCNRGAGNPGLWPLVFSHKENPGIAVPHHMKCVQMRLDEYEEMKARDNG